MHCADLPWVYGGEYDAFSGLILQVVSAWLNVGLRLYFVFDGMFVHSLPSLLLPLPLCVGSGA